MSFQGVNTNKNQGGLVRGSDSSDRTLLLVVGCASSQEIVHYTPFLVGSLKELEAKGRDETTDVANGEMLHYHVCEVFRLSPERYLYVMPVPKTQKVSLLTEDTSFLAAIRSIPGINTIGIAGIAADGTLQEAITKTQQMVNDFQKDHIYIDGVLLEGLGGYLTADSISEYEDLRALKSENVCCVIAQDPEIAALHAGYAGYAAVGSALGMLSVRYVHENLGSVDIENHPRGKKGTEDYPLTDVLSSRWLTATLSNGIKVSELEMSEQNTLTGKGYVYVGSFQGYSGCFFSNSPTCTDKESPYAYLEYNAIWNKGARLIRNTLIPRIRSKVKADPSTGYISNTTIADWDQKVRKVMDTLVSADNISGYDLYINPSQMAVSQAPFSIQVTMVADGVVNEFDVDLGFTNKI